MSSLFKELPDIDKTRRQIEMDQRQRYAPYGLIKNPFPLGGSFPEGYLRYTYLDQKQERQIADFLFSTFHRGEFNGLLILGEYGTGKSHLLNYIYEQVNTDNHGIFGGRALAFIIENPSVAPEDILISLLRKIRLGTVQDLVFLPVRRELQKQYGGNLLDFLTEYTTFSLQISIPDSILEGQTYQPAWFTNLLAVGYREFYQTLKSQKVKLDLTKMQKLTQDVLLSQVTDNLTIAEGLAALLFDDESKDTHSWEAFLINSLMGKRGRVVGVEFYLGAILQLFKLMGIHHVYLLVDEVEDLRTQRLSPKAATEYLATLRRMIQHNYKMFSFVLASARDAWNELKLYYPAIEDRFPVTIDLVRTTANVKQIIAKYLSEARDDQRPPDDQWFPFSEAAIDRLIQIRGSSLLRHIITECRKLIDIAVIEGTPAPLTPEFVEEHVEQSSYQRDPKA